MEHYHADWGCFTLLANFSPSFDFQFRMLIWRLKTCSTIIFRVGSDSHKHISSFVLDGIIKPKPGADLKYWTISVVIQNTKEEDVSGCHSWWTYQYKILPIDKLLSLRHFYLICQSNTEAISQCVHKIRRSPHLR